jgi:hypothetical protein
MGDLNNAMSLDNLLMTNDSGGSTGMIIALLVVVLVCCCCCCSLASEVGTVAYVKNQDDTSSSLYVFLFGENTDAAAADAGSIAL